MKTHRLSAAVAFILMMTYAYGQTTFEDITSDLNLPDLKADDPWGSGVSAADYDDDGDIDIFLTTAANSPNLLLTNIGNGFYSKTVFEKNWNSIASLWLDYNGDHKLDLLVAGNCPYGATGCNTGSYWILYEQKTGNTFEDVTEKAGLSQISGLTVEHLGGLSAGDINLDGYVDIVMAYWTGPVLIFMNNRDGTFDNKSDMINSGGFGPFWQPIIFDLDGDGWPEIYLTEEFQNKNQLWKHNGDMNFKDIAPEVGLDSDCDDMGVTLGDVDNDGDLDIYITCREYDELYSPLFINNGFLFEEKAVIKGVSESGWAWGATFFEVNNDGFQDLAVTNGVLGVAETDQSKLWINLGNGSFNDVSQATNFNDQLRASALIALDMDRDGDQDLIQSVKPENGNNAPAFRFLRNRLEQNNKGNFIVIKPRMKGQNHWAIGAYVKITYDNTAQIRPITAGISYFGQEPAEAFFGLGNTDIIDEIEIIWPGGSTTILSGVPANQVLTVTDDGVSHPPFITQTTYADQGSINLFWTHTNTASGFTLEYSEDSLFNTFNTINIEGTRRNYTLQGLLPSEKYFIRMKSLSGVSSSNPGNIVSFFAPEASLLQPENLQFSFMNSSAVNLTWEDNAVNETGYLIERSFSNDFSNPFITRLDPDETQHLAENLQPGFNYFFRVKAFTTHWTSPYSNQIRVFIQPVINDINSESPVHVYPNPSDETIYIASKAIPYEIIVTDISGKTILNLYSENREISFSLAKGTYIIQIYDNNRTVTYEKILIK